MAACSKSVENQDNVAETEVSVGEVLEMPVSGSEDTSVIAESRGSCRGRKLRLPGRQH